MSLPRKLTASALALCLAALLPSCDSGITAPTLDRLGTDQAGGKPPVVRLDRSELQLVAGESAHIGAQVVSASGSPVSGAAVSWSSSAPEVVSVGGEGTVSAHRAGEATVTATAGQASATARVRVSPRIIAALDVSPEEDTIHAVGTSVDLRARALDPSGAPVTGATIAWASMDTAVAVVDGDGRVTSRKTGMARITAAAGDKSDTVRVHVRGAQSISVQPEESVLNAIGDTVRLAADARDSRGGTAPATAVKWSSLNPAVATVEGPGLVTGRATGVARIVAEYAGRADTARVEVRQVVASLDVTPSAPGVQAGQTQQMVATARDGNGNEIPGVVFGWTSSNTPVATVSGTGLVSAVAAGVSYVTAAAGGKSATATVTVTAAPVVPAPVASVSVSPATASLTVGGTADLDATAKDAAGNPLTGRTVSWSSSNPAVATVSVAGVVTAVSAGSATVKATVEGKTGTAAVTVSVDPATVPSRVSVAPQTATVDALGASAQLTATVYSAAGSPMSGVAVSWSSLDTGVATVDGAGNVVAKAVGTARVVARAGTLADTSMVTVRQRVASVSVTPSAASVQADGTQQLQASARDANGNEIPGVVFGWTSSNTPVATVSGTGLVSAVAAGVSYVTAAAGGKSATATVTVTAAPVVPAPVASVSVSPATASLTVGGTADLDATAKDAAGNALTGRTVSWSSSNPAVATVSVAGVVTAVSAGSATVKATVEGKTGTAAVTVSADPATVPSRVTVTPGTDTLNALGASAQLTATVHSAAGSRLAGAAVSWSSLNAGVATVDAAGRVVAKAVGTARVVATSGGLADTATVLVRQVVVSVAVSPAAPVLAAGSTQQVAATAKDANGNAIAGADFTWTSSNAAAATVNRSGLVSAVAAGVSYVTAASGGKTAVSTVTVAAPAVASVTVSPSSASLDVGQKVALAAVVKDASGRVLAGKTVAWTTSNPAVATVSAAGVVTGIAAGSATITGASEGKSDNSAVTVSAPVTGPALAFNDGFESGALAAPTTTGYRWRRPSAKSGSSVAVSRDIARSGTSSLKFLYGANATRCEDGWAEQRFELGENLKEVWFEYYIYLPKGTEGLGPKFTHREPAIKNSDGTCSTRADVSTNNKFFALWDTKYNDIDVMLLMEYRRSKYGADGDSRLYNMWGSTGGGVVMNRNKAEGGGTWDSFITDATRGRWVQVRIHVRLADSIEAANGVVELWFDGVKRINDTGLTLVSTDPDARNFFRNGYIMGWANSGFNEATSMYVDDFRIFRSSPAW